MQFVDLHELNATELPMAGLAAAVDARASKFAHATPVASSWSDLGRLVRTAAMTAVTEHFASLATGHDEFRPSLGRGPSPSPSQGEGGCVPNDRRSAAQAEACGSGGERNFSTDQDEVPR